MTGVPGIHSVPAIPTTAVFGATGFIGRNILSGLLSINPSCVGVSRRPGNGQLLFDLAAPDISTLRLKERGVTHAVIAAGITGIGECEQHPSSTHAVNVVGTAELARQLNRKGIRIIALSSDYVFDGKTGNYDEGSPVNPLNEYGRQKAEIEKRLLKVKDILIIRLCRVFDTKRGSGTLLDEMAENMLQGKPVRAAADQYFCPTHIDDVVAVLFQLIGSKQGGIFHLCAPEKMSRLQIAAGLASTLGCSKLVQGISLSDLKEKFTRPLDTSMICRRLTASQASSFASLNSCFEELKRNFSVRDDLKNTVVS